jgi:hypothetical protein
MGATSPDKTDILVGLVGQPCHAREPGTA